MTNDRFALGVGRDQLFKIAVTSRQALVLTQVFCPRHHVECLEVNVGLFEIALETPSRRPIATPDAFVTPHPF